MIKIKIDNRDFSAHLGQTILEVAKENKIKIPALCRHPDLTAKSLCRLCLVEIKGVRTLQTACSTLVKEDMEVITSSEKIKKLRKTNLELIFSQHNEECEDCVWLENCELLKLAQEYKVKINRFPDRKSKRPIRQSGPIVHDQTKCIDCRDCLEACPVNYLELEGRGSDIEVSITKDKKKDCIYCGACVTHCPAGAIEAVGEFESIEKPLQEKDRIVVVQFAPAIRTSIGEEFGIPYGEDVTEKLAPGLRKLGFNKVFDTSVGADFTTFEEAQELVERVKSGKGLPILTSCCPAWVKFVEFYHPELIPHLATTRSPQVIMGGLIKTYWAEKEKIDPQKIYVVSVMPCTAKKFEVRRSELKVNGLWPVDYVMTTRELARLFLRHKIDLKNLTPEKCDDPLGMPSGAGLIYGATGGVAESALRTAYFKVTGRNLEKLEIEAVRGAKGIKIAEIELGGRKERAAIVHGIGNAKKIVEELKQNLHKYDCVEVMSCRGGCIGGGGQPMPMNDKIRLARAEGLYKGDKNKKIRLAHENPIVKQVYREFLTNNEIRHKICHTKYFKKKRGKIYKLKNSLKTYGEF